MAGWQTLPPSLTCDPVLQRPYSLMIYVSDIIFMAFSYYCRFCLTLVKQNKVMLEMKHISMKMAHLVNATPRQTCLNVQNYRLGQLVLQVLII